MDTTTLKFYIFFLFLAMPIMPLSAQNTLDFSANLQLKTELDSIKLTYTELVKRNGLYDSLQLTADFQDSIQIITFQAKDNIYSGNYSRAKVIYEYLLHIMSFEYQELHSLNFLLGYIYLNSGDYKLAIHQYNTVVNRYSSEAMIEKCIIYLGAIYDRLGEYKLAVEVYEDLPLNTIDEKYAAYNQIATVYYHMKEYEMAMNFVNKCLSLNLPARKRSTVHFVKGNIEFYQKNYEESYNSYLNAISIDRTDKLLLIKIYNNISSVLWRLGDYNSIVYADSALSILQDMHLRKYNYHYAVGYQNKGEYYSSVGEHTKAIAYIDSAIYNHCYGIAIEGSPSNYVIDPLILDDKISLIEYLDVRIDILEAAGEKEQLEQTYFLIDSVIQAIREERFDDTGRFFQQSKLSKYYREAFEYFINKGDLTNAYKFAQKTKNVVLFEKVHFRTVENALPTDVKKGLENLQDSLIQLTEIPVEKSNRDSLQFEISKLKVSLLNFQNQLKKDFPSYHRQRFQESSISIEELQNTLSSDQLLLDYYFTDSVIHVFIVGQSNFKYENLEIDSSVIRELKELSSWISTRPNITDFSETSFSNQLDRLKLISNFVLPDNYHEANELIIIPDGLLFLIPFETLVTSAEANCPFLVCQKHVSYSFSSHLWQLSKQIDSESVNGFVFSPHQQNQNSELYLPRAASESSVVADILETEVIQSLDVEQFLANFEKYNVHHLLSHAFVNMEEASSSYISLGGDGNKVEFSDLLNSNLESRLVTLSACQTGSGQLVDAEGVLSLGRGFIEAGAQSVVMSSHKVPDKASAEVMTNFYRKLKNGDNKSKALSEAKSDYIRNVSTFNKHPYFWSGFTIQGNEEPLFISYSWYIQAIVGAVLLAFVLLVMGKREDSPT